MRSTSTLMQMRQPDWLIHSYIISRKWLDVIYKMATILAVAIDYNEYSDRTNEITAFAIDYSNRTNKIQGFVNVCTNNYFLLIPLFIVVIPAVSGSTY